MILAKTLYKTHNDKFLVIVKVFNIKAISKKL